MNDHLAELTEEKEQEAWTGKKKGLRGQPLAFPMIGGGEKLGNLFGDCEPNLIAQLQILCPYQDARIPTTCVSVSLLSQLGNPGIGLSAQPSRFDRGNWRYEKSLVEFDLH